MLRKPWGASVTFWEATAPVKLPARHCPPPGFTGSGLEFHFNQGGIPRATPPRLAPQLHCLPPILYKLKQNPISSCSKGAQGLSVLSRVTSIFTGSTTSPGLPSRQCSDRYAIRAGRNLPDKEFRYLRTVIVTAAINRGFGSKLRTAEAALTSPVNLPALGRRQSLYVVLRLSRDLCF
jgi:hypothetical protein